MKLTLGKRYKTRSGVLTSPLRINDYKHQLKDGYIYRVDFMDSSGSASYTDWGSVWKNSVTDANDLVEEVTTEGLEVKVKGVYRTRHGEQVIISFIGSHTTYPVSGWTGSLITPRSYTLKGFYYDQTMGEMLNDWDLIEEWTEEGKAKPVQKAVRKSVKEEIRKIRYNNLRFIEAYEFARETKKRYRFKDQEWLTFPEVKITKEQFDKNEWELEKG